MKRPLAVAAAALLLIVMSTGIAAADPNPPPANDHNCEAVVGIAYLPVSLGWNGYSHLAQDAIEAGDNPADSLGRKWAGNTDYAALKHANCGNHNAGDHAPS